MSTVIHTWYKLEMHICIYLYHLLVHLSICSPYRPYIIYSLYALSLWSGNFFEGAKMWARVVLLCLQSFWVELSWFDFFLRHRRQYFSHICEGTKMCRQIEEDGPTVGLPCHRHFIRFFYVTVKALTGGHPFYGYSEKLDPPLSRRWIQQAA